MSKKLVHRQSNANPLDGRYTTLTSRRAFQMSRGGVQIIMGKIKKPVAKKPKALRGRP